MINIEWKKASLNPFPHTKLHSAISMDVANEALKWLQTRAPWTLRVEEFYVQHEFSLLSAETDGVMAQLASDLTVRQVSDALSAAFAPKRTLKFVDLNAHRLTAGQVIRIHNDYIEGAETHRFLIQLNSGWSASKGGLLMLFADDDVSSVRDIILPEHGSGFAFEISLKSFHAVSEIKEGERYTLVYTFSES